MTIKEAKEIRDRLGAQYKTTPEEQFLFNEAMEFLIQEEKNPADMTWLGGTYYDRKRFDLALKYYEMAAEYDYDPALSSLGYMWYYGRVGEPDYEKAFHYFTRSAEKGNIQSQYKLADMYKNGYYVERDYRKYCRIIEELYHQLSRTVRYVEEPLTEVCIRLAGIRAEEGRTDEAIDLYLEAKNWQAQRLQYNSFFGDRSIMRDIEENLFRLTEFDEEDFDLYDLYVLLKHPVRVSFYYNNEEQKLEAVEDEDGIAVSFNGKWFRTADDFFENAAIGEKPLTTLYKDLYRFEVTG